MSLALNMLMREVVAAGMMMIGVRDPGEQQNVNITIKS